MIVMLLEERKREAGRQACQGLYTAQTTVEFTQLVTAWLAPPLVEGLELSFASKGEPQLSRVRQYDMQGHC